MATIVLQATMVENYQKLNKTNILVANEYINQMVYNIFIIFW